MRQSTALAAELESRLDSSRRKAAQEPSDPEVLVRLVRITEGNFRLLTRLLTQIERIFSINDTEIVSLAIVEAARDSLVIGQS